MIILHATSQPALTRVSTQSGSARNIVSIQEPFSDASTGGSGQVNFRAIRVHHLFRGRSAQTLFDQILVSASNFITGIILVRGLGLVEFGKFTVAYVVLLLANSVQLSFISSPMITLGSLCPEATDRLRFVRGMYGVQLTFWCNRLTGSRGRRRNLFHRGSHGSSYRLPAPFRRRCGPLSHAGLVTSILLHCK